MSTTWTNGAATNAWATAGNWSNGAPSSSVDVIFNGTSSATCVIPLGSQCKSLTATGYTGKLSSTITGSGALQLQVFGDVTLDSSFDYTGTREFQWRANGIYTSGGAASTRISILSAATNVVCTVNANTTVGNITLQGTGNRIAIGTTTFTIANSTLHNISGDGAFTYSAGGKLRFAGSATMSCTNAGGTTIPPIDQPVGLGSTVGPSFGSGTWNTASITALSGRIVASGTGILVVSGNFSQTGGSIGGAGLRCTVSGTAVATGITITLANFTGGTTLNATSGCTDSGSNTNVAFALPYVTSVSASSGPAAGSTAVTITGLGFSGVTGVTFGGNAATGVSTVNSTTVTCTTPAHAAGAVNVVVTNGDTTTATGTNAYTYVAAPTVTSVTANSGPAAGSTAVTIAGTGFSTTVTGVTFGGVAATSVVRVSAISITCVTPAHAAGAVDVVVTNNDAQTGTGTNVFTYVAAPTVTLVTSNSGPAAGGTAVTVTGTGFLGVTGVTFGGVAATGIITVGPTSVTCTTPAHAAGAVNVVVTNGDTQTGTGVSAFTYIAAPTVTLVSPDHGPATGGNTVLVTGTNFSSVTNVSFGGVPATSVVTVDPTSLTCTPPLHLVGLVNVAVTTFGTQTGTGIGLYEYRATLGCLFIL